MIQPELTGVVFGEAGLGEAGLVRAVPLGVGGGKAIHVPGSDSCRNPRGFNHPGTISHDLDFST